VQLPAGEKAGQLHARALQFGSRKANCAAIGGAGGASIHVSGRRDLTNRSRALLSMLLLFRFLEPFGPCRPHSSSHTSTEVDLTAHDGRSVLVCLCFSESCSQEPLSRHRSSSEEAVPQFPSPGIQPSDERAIARQLEIGGEALWRDFRDPLRGSRTAASCACACSLHA